MYKLWRKIFVWIIVFQFTTNTASAESMVCQSLFVTESNNIHIPDFDFPRAAGDINNRLARFTPEEHLKARNAATEILSDLNDSQITSVPKTLSRHLLIGLAYAAYTLTALFGGEYYMLGHFREAGNTNFFTEHSTNFFEGIGFIGFLHHFFSIKTLLGVQTARSLYSPRVQKFMEQVTDKLYQARIKSMGQPGWAIRKYHYTTFLFTAALFTGTNALFELHGLATQKPLGWIDFFSGEAGLVFYYLMNQYVDKYLFRSMTP